MQNRGFPAGGNHHTSDGSFPDRLPRPDVAAPWPVLRCAEWTLTDCPARSVPQGAANGGKKPDWSQTYWSAGGYVNIAVYQNEGEKGPTFSTTLNRSYKDGDAWKKTQNFRPEDLLVIAFACQQAYQAIAEQRKKEWHRIRNMLLQKQLRHNHSQWSGAFRSHASLPDVAKKQHNPVPTPRSRS